MTASGNMIITLEYYFITCTLGSESTTLNDMMPQAMQCHLVTYQTSLLVETVVCSVIVQTKHTG